MSPLWLAFRRWRARVWIARRVLRSSIALARVSYWLIGNSHRALMHEEVTRCLAKERR